MRGLWVVLVVCLVVLVKAVQLRGVPPAPAGGYTYEPAPGMAVTPDNQAGVAEAHAPEHPAPVGGPPDPFYPSAGNDAPGQAFPGATDVEDTGNDEILEPPIRKPARRGQCRVPPLQHYDPLGSNEPIAPPEDADGLAPQMAPLTSGMAPGNEDAQQQQQQQQRPGSREYNATDQGIPKWLEGLVNPDDLSGGVNEEVEPMGVSRNQTDRLGVDLPPGSPENLAAPEDMMKRGNRGPVTPEIPKPIHVSGGGDAPGFDPYPRALDDEGQYGTQPPVPIGGWALPDRNSSADQSQEAIGGLTTGERLTNNWNISVELEREGVGLTPEEIKLHMGDPVHADWERPETSPFECSDGRTRGMVFATPGGEFVEWLLGLAVFDRFSMKKMQSQQDVLDMMRKYVGQSSKGSFIMCTDSNAVEELRTMMSDETLDLTNPRKEQLKELKERVSDPRFIGCEHLRLIVENPKDYGVEAHLVQWAVQSFFDILWNRADRISNKMMLNVREGEHMERAVVKLYGMAMGSLQPKASPYTPSNQVFLVQPDAAKVLRKKIAAFFAMQLADEMAAEMDTTGNAQLQTTLDFVAEGLPIYKVTETFMPV